MLKPYAPQSDRGVFYFFDDFGGGGLDARTWGVGGSSGGSVTKLAALAGQVRVTVGGTAGNEYYLIQDTFKNYDTARLVDLSWRVKIENLSYATHKFGFRVDATHRIQIVYDSTVSANWLSTAVDGASQTQVVSGVAVDTNWHRLRIIGTTASMDFFVDATLIGTITTNIPSGDAGIIAYAYRNSGGSGTRSHLVDWVEAVGARA